ncbi:AbiV family abortive infection protein [Agrobacterium tumefaciens]|nr:AbiV family abortive infection protein [Agrobacterium tumefaciens]NTE22224.1 AbiV family abortive infection protein [Agrobacterium tumefaciens]
MKNLAEFINFRKLCLENAKTAIRSAKELQDKQANHIAFHLCILSLEEIGKVVICWSNYCNYQKTNLDKPLVIDDHIKKLFWAIWWPLLGQEIPTQADINEYKSLASNIHHKRLESLYTEIADTVPSHEKVTDADLAYLIKFVGDRLEGALENEIIDKPVSKELDSFMQYTEEPEKRAFIFGHESQHKLVKMGDVMEWMKWVIERIQSDENKMKTLLQKELSREIEVDSPDLEIPKWEIKIKLKSALHTIRPKILKDYNEKFPNFRLDKGKDNNTLLLTLTFYKHVKADELWHFGFLMSQIYVTALNIATSGVIWWHVPVDLDKFYEQIRDLENNTKIETRVVSKLHWPEANQVLTFDNLILATLVNNYIVKSFKTPNYWPFQNYMHAMALLSKNDIHLRFENQMFEVLYRTYRNVIIQYQNNGQDENFAEAGYQQIKAFLRARENYDNIIDLGEQMIDNKIFQKKLTLTEVLSIRNYLSTYLITLAVREKYNDNTITLTPMTGSGEPIA